MRTIQEVIRSKETELKQKELSIQQLLKELEALRLAARLMAEEETTVSSGVPATAPPAMTMAPSATPAPVREPGYSPGWSTAPPKQFP
jgi:hypothetical protein